MKKILLKYFQHSKYFVVIHMKSTKKRVDDGRLKIIDVYTAKTVKKSPEFKFLLIPGKKLCHNYSKKLNQELSNIVDNTESLTTFTKLQGSDLDNVPDLPSSEEV